jgi:hypothetical protein
MRRLSRLTEALGSDAALTVTGRLLDGPATQKALLKVLADEGIAWTQPRFSALMTRLEDLGMVARKSQKAPYELTHPESAAALIHHLAALGVAIAREDGDGAEELERLAHRARLRPTAPTEAKDTA